MKCFGTNWDACYCDHCKSISRGVVEIKWELDMDEKRAHFFGKYSLLTIAEADFDLDKVSRVLWHD